MRNRDFNLCKGFIKFFILVFFPLLSFGQIHTKEDIDKIQYEIGNLNDTVVKLQNEFVKIQTSNNPLVNNIRFQDELIISKKNNYEQLKKNTASTIIALQNTIKQLEVDSVNFLIDSRKFDLTSTTIKEQISTKKNDINKLQADSLKYQLNINQLRIHIDDNKRKQELIKDSLKKDTDNKMNYLYNVYNNRLNLVNRDSSISSINYNNFIEFRNSLVQLQLNSNRLAVPEQFIQYQSLINGVKNILNGPLPLN